ncbi:MAG: PatB family C-S lyase [Bacilli bacterium]
MIDFDKRTNRLGTDSTKWNVKKDELPMWIADMDFKTFPKVTENIIKRARIGTYGYSDVSEEWKKSVVSWFKKHHEITFRKDSVIFSTGVVPALSACVERLSNVGDNVLVMTPVYNIFYNCILNHGRQVIQSPLIYKDHIYSIDFKDLEKKMASPLTNLMILCNPHNPIGKIFTEEELKKIGDLARKHNVIVLSDEIHCDLTDPDKEYVPFALANKGEKGYVTLVSASKCFNMAGLQGAAVIVEGESLFNMVNRALNTYEVAEPNFFVQEAMITAFDEGYEWLKSLKTYIYKNKKLVSDFIRKKIPELYLIESEATYLLWIDISKVAKDADDFVSFLRKKTGLILSSGTIFGGNGKTFVRMNVATQKKNVEDGLNRLLKGVELYKKRKQ